MSTNQFEELLEKELFVVSPNQELLCPICICVLKDPQQIKDCGHMFCKNCITAHFNCHPFCPIDGKSISMDKIVAVPRSIVNIISELQLRCFYQRNGCPYIMTLKNLLDNHAQLCRNRPVSSNISSSSDKMDDSESPINVLVKLASPAKTIVVPITTEATVRMLKQRIREKEEVDPFKMILNFKGKTLKDTEVLSKYGVKSNDIFYMTRYFDGGAQPSN